MPLTARATKILSFVAPPQRSPAVAPNDTQSTQLSASMYDQSMDPYEGEDVPSQFTVGDDDSQRPGNRIPFSATPRSQLSSQTPLRGSSVGDDSVSGMREGSYVPNLYPKGTSDGLQSSQYRNTPSTPQLPPRGSGSASSATHAPSPFSQRYVHI
jgi:hypothetical protein